MSVQRVVKGVIIFLLLAVVASMVGLVTMSFLLSRPPSVSSNSVLMLRVPGGLSERRQNPQLTSFIGIGPTVRSIVDSLRKAKVDTRIRGVVLLPSGSQQFWGKVQEIRDAVLEYKRSGKPIVAFLEYGGTQEYYLASAADKIFLMPGSQLDLVGVASHTMFIRNALDSLDAFPDMLNAGNFKTAANFYTETMFTPEHREMAESLNRELYEQIIEGVAETRHMTGNEVRHWINEGPFLPDDALAAGLVDGLVYADELKRQAPFDEFSWSEIEDREYRQTSLESVGLNEGQRIALVYAVGTISSGAGGIDILGGEVIGSDTLVEAIRDARTDESVRAIVLRVDSPGGSAVASDAIWREVVLAKEDKPVIVSMSGLGASGGYYIGMAADTIVAQPATLTGSIGVVAGKIATGGTYKKAGITFELIEEGRFAGIYSPLVPFSEEERTKMQQHIEAVYERFLTKAADGRGITRDAVHEVAQGRVWTGRQARERGLVDELGGLGRAVKMAKARIGIDADTEVELVVYPRPRSLFELLNEGISVAQRFMRVHWFSLPSFQALGTVPPVLRLFRNGEPLALMPDLFVP